MMTGNERPRGRGGGDKGDGEVTASTLQRRHPVVKAALCPVCGESHDETIVLLAQTQLRRIPDRDLLDELTHSERELIEIRADGSFDVELGSYLSHRHDVLRYELKRRERLAAMGGPAVGKNGLISDDVIQAIKDAVNLDDLSWQLSVPVFGSPTSSRRPMCCPLPAHQDRHPSAVLYATEGRWWCHRCNQGGDAFDLVMAVQGVTWRQAAEWLAAYANIKLQPDPPKRTQPPSLKQGEEREVLRGVLA